MDKISFLAIISPSVSALKVDGTDTGGKLQLSFDDSQLADVLKVVMMREKLLKITVEVMEE